MSSFKIFEIAASGMAAESMRLNTVASNLANANTLLLAFFVVMYSVSSLNSGKYRVMSEALMAAFRGEPQRDMPITLSIREGMPSSDLVTMPETEKAMDPRPIRKTDAQGMDTGMSLSGIAGNVAKALERQVMTDQVTIRQHSNWVEVEIRNDLLFSSGSAGLAGEAADIVRKLGASLASLKNPIFVKGHTDNVPIRTAQFPSNGELSGARAGAVVRLLGEGGANTSLMTVIGTESSGRCNPTIPLRAGRPIAV
ncbi:MAG: flagellar motor protein MotB [Nevskiaceae bacterium]